jgi:hypothetical protein
MKMPRSEIKKIADMIELIKKDDDLRRDFAQLIVETIERDFSLKLKIGKLVLGDPPLGQ